MTINSWQHTKIICTLGPATDGPGVLEGMIRGGMDVARINMSHGTHEDHARRIQAVREVSRNLASPVCILAKNHGVRLLDIGLLILLITALSDTAYSHY